MIEPHSIAMEQQLLGACLINNQVYGLCESIVSPESYFEPIHTTIWQTMGQLITLGKVASPVTLQAFLPTGMKIGTMTLGQYLAQLAAQSTTIVNCRDFARNIRDLSDIRALRNVGNEILIAQTTDADELSTWAIDQIDTIASARFTQDSPSLTLAASVVRAVDAAAKAYQNDGAVTGMSYGLRDLDIKTGGLHRGELTLLAGRPGMMKTGVALNFCRSLCSEHIDEQTGEVLNPGYRGIFFSLEMGDILLSQRLMSDMIFGQARSREVPYSRIRKGVISETEFGYLTSAGLALAKLPLQIEQQGGMNLAQVGAKARQQKRKGGLDFIIVDYLQLMGVADRYRGNRVSEVSELSSGLLKLAKDLDVAMLALCQLNRGVENREDKRPSLADLRESGSLEQDASLVIMLYRKAYYLQNKEPKPGTPEYEQWQTDMIECWNKLNIQIEKNRSGPVGMVEAYVNPAVNAVRDLNAEYPQSIGDNDGLGSI